MASSPLSSILQTVGLNPSTEHIQITGQDPILPTPFLVGEAGGAALASVGHAAAALWQLKTGQLQSVQVSVRDAAIAQRSHLYLKKLQGETPELWSPFSGFYETQDQRWIQFHCNFTHHQQGVLNLLRCPADKNAVIAAVKQWQGEQLEQILNEQGMCAALLRTPVEWQAHPHAQAVAKLPLLEIIKMDNSVPKRLPEGPNPLSQIRVLDLTRVLAGPVCGKILAQLGADVLRVASPELPFILPLVMDTGFGKRSVYLNLDQPEQKQQLLNLVATGDVFLQAYRPGALAARGFSPKALAELRPGIIYVDLSAYSHVGPWANRHGYDSLVQTATGIAYEQSVGKAKPQHLPAQSLDYLTGYFATFAIMEALRRRAIEGGSYWIRLSLLQTAHWFTHLGRAKNFEACKSPAATEIAEFLEIVNTPFGELEHLKPVLQLSETPLRDRSVPVPLGTHSATWL